MRLRLALLLLALPATAAAQPYTVVDLGRLPGAEFTSPTSVNNQLQVVGYSGSEYVLWDGTGLHSLGVPASGRLVINNNGLIAGVRVVNGLQRAFVWAGGVAFEPLHPPEQVIEVRGLTDNNLLLMQGTTRSWLLYGQSLIDLTAALGGSAYALNANGVIGGSTGSRPFLRFADGRIITPWDAPAPVLVVGPGGHFAGFPPGTVFQPFWYYGQPDGTVTTITPFGTGNGMSLRGMNRRGDLVGHISQHGGRVWAMLYRDGHIFDLNTLIAGPTSFHLLYAEGINDLGWIVATARIGTAFTPTYAVLLVPTVPAPPSGVTFTLNGRLVTVQWQSSVGALEYIVEAGSAPGLSNFYNASVGAQLTISGTVPPGRYYVRLRARNAVGVSTPSAEIVIDVP